MIIVPLYLREVCRSKRRVLRNCFVGSLLAGVLTACGGAGDVRESLANRGHQIDRLSIAHTDSRWLVQVATRAIEFDTENGVSTRGSAEVIYRPESGGVIRPDRSNFVLDALERAKIVSGCADATLSHTQDSLQGVHVMAILDKCPPMSRP